LLGSQDVRKRLYGKQAPDFAWASVIPKSPLGGQKPASSAQDKPKRNPYFVEALKWTCPVCHEELTVRGHDNGLQQCKRHLKVMHNLMPHQVGGSRSHKAKLGAKKRAHKGAASVAIQRAIMKKKQVEHEHDHDLVHSTTQGLFPYFRKTWFCKKCVKRGCAREMAQKKCNMDYWDAHCAKWWNRIPSNIKDKIHHIANWAVDFRAALDQSAEKWAHLPAAKKNWHGEEKIQRQKAERKRWRHGFPEKASGTGGRAAARHAITEVTKHKGRAMTAKRRAELASMFGSDRLSPAAPDHPQGGWQRNLCQDGDVEPNPGPHLGKRRPRWNSKQLKVWQVNLDSWKLRGWDLLREAEDQSVDIICAQELKLRKHEGISLAHHLKNWQFFYIEEAQINERHGPEGGCGIFVHKTVPAVRAQSFHNSQGQWIRVTGPGIHLINVYRRPLSQPGPEEQFDRSLCEEVIGLGQCPVLILGDFNREPLTFLPFQSIPQLQLVCVMDNAGTPDAPIWVPLQPDGRATGAWTGERVDMFNAMRNSVKTNGLTTS
jgi:hypothetical protein